MPENSASNSHTEAGDRNNCEEEIERPNSNSDGRKSKEIKRKNSSVIPKNNITGIGKKKRQNYSGQKASCSASSLSVLQRKLSTNFACLSSQINQSRLRTDLYIENFKEGDQQTRTNKESRNRFTASVAPVPRPHRFVRAKKLHTIDKQSKKSLVVEVASKTNNTSEGDALGRNQSSPNLVISTNDKSNIKFDSGPLSCSQTLASEFPNVVQFYNNDIALARSSNRKFTSLPLNRWKGQQYCNTLPLHSNQSPFTIRQSRGAARLPYCRSPFTCASSHSVPSTAPNLLNISGKSQKKSKFFSSLRFNSSGWSCLRGLTTSDLANISFDVTESFDVGSESATSTTSHADITKSLDSETLSLISSFGKAMNAKNKQQVTATNQKNAQLQYHTGRPRPRISSNFSSSFILPYGLGNRVQSSPVTTPAVPSSSSFHGGPLESLQLMSENHRSAQRQQSQCHNGQRQQRKYLDRQKMKMLKPLGVNKNQGNITKLYDISTSEFSAAILPDPGTTSYRLTHDVSFDEGSRYRTTGDFSHNLVKGKEDSRNHANINGLSNQFSSTMLTRNNETSNSAGPMRHEGRITVNNREHNNNNMTNTSNNNSNNISFKETVPLSLIRMDERFAADLPPASSPSSPAMSSALAASTSTSSFIPPPSASRQNASNTTITTAGGNIMFRLHKEKQNWNYRLGELSISGGGYYSSAVNSNTRTDLDTISSLNMTSISSTTQRAVSTRERISVAPKSRLSSRYTSKSDTNPAPSFSDPCISAPASFQQRLTDLSLLESETIKYERNRKLRRKKNQQDKDS